MRCWMQIEHWAARSQSSALSAGLSNCCSSRSVQELNRLLSSSHSLGVESVSAPREGRYFLLCTQFSRVTRGPTDAEALVRTQRCETRLSFGKNRTPQPGVGSAFTFIMTCKPFSVLLWGHWSPSQNPHSVRSYFSYVERRNWFWKWLHETKV